MNITIVGGGFGGVKAALELAKRPQNHITLISDKDDFQYYPALYSAATGHSHLESWVPLGEIFAGKDNIRVEIDTITMIDPATKTLRGASGEIYTYQQCILALGSVTTYFGIEGLDTYAYGIKSEAEIQQLKRHLYEDIAKRRTLEKHYVVIGAGPTGVELAAALGSYIKRLSKHYGVKKRTIEIDVIEAAPRVLPKMSEKSSATVLRHLRKLGVVVHTNQKVESGSAEGVVVNGKPLRSRTVIWTSGVANHPFYKANAEHFTLAPNGKVIVDDYMQGAKDVYVIGDNAATKFSGLAQTALHDALFVAKTIHRKQLHQPLQKYHAVMPPVVVPVGKNWAVFEWKGIRLSGWVASLIRRAADFLGYTDILPLGQALGVWRASRIIEDNYFTPTGHTDDSKSRA